MPQHLTTGDIARRYGLPLWRVRELFNNGHLPTPQRCGLYRVLPADQLPVVEQVLRDRGLLKGEPEMATA